MDETILAMEHAALERWRQGDPMVWEENSSDDVIYVDPDRARPIVGMEEYLVFLRSLIGQVHYQGSEFIDPRIVVVGDAAVLSYNYVATVLAEDGSVAERTPWNTTQVYFRRDGRWQAVHSHWAYTGQKLPAQIEVPVPMRMAAAPYEGVLGELMALEAAAMERWRKGDPWGFIEISAPEVTYFDTGTPLRLNGRDVLAAEYVRREGKIFYDVMDFVDPQVRVCGDMAVLFYRFLSTWLDPDGSVSHRTPWNCTEVFVRREGQWRIVHTHWSFVGGEKA
jgi:ketosteroid isomerase-like protein